MSSGIFITVIQVTLSIANPFERLPMDTEEAGPSARIFAAGRSARQVDDDDDLEYPSEPLFGQPNESQEVKQDEDLYSILNVSKDASVDVISQRYRSLVVLLHPDKQRNPSAKFAAETQFRRIQRAYEILVDEQKRALYDTLGEEGLKGSWEVGFKLKTPEEMRAEFTRQANEKKFLTQQRLVSPKGDFNVQINAESLLAPKSAFYGPRGPKNDGLLTRLRFVHARGLTLAHSFQVGLGQSTMLDIAGTMTQRIGQKRAANRLGGTMVGTIKHQFSPRLYTEVSASVLNPKLLAVRTIYEIDDETALDISARAFSPLTPPNIDLTLTRLIYPTLKSYLTLRSGSFGYRGDESSLTIGLTSHLGDTLPTNGWTAEIECGPGDVGTNLDWSKVVWAGWEFKVGGSAALSGGKVHLSWARKITKFIKATLSVEAETTAGLTLKLRLFRLGQRVTIPILITRTQSQWLVGAFLAPCVAVGVAHYAWLGPRKRRLAASRWKQLQEDNQELIEQMKQEAEQTVEMLQPVVERRIAEEEKADGLIILEAQYGALQTFSARSMPSSSPLSSTSPAPSSKDSTSTSADYIDVSIPLQALITDSQLVIPRSKTKAGLLGFWDPCLGAKKSLRVRYLFKGRLHEVVIKDREPLVLPLREHAIEER
ncbi:Molecular chaperone (DnaJ superfamily) [Phaffia rhodozyma]|uniref:Molecular chaperone (DnaJ superfamily) n=1 Tax=Phaffia rhodozyma TaxID=264483 RepID=A0A0F7SJ92_PHARH|nr:Molecular chaperone (DnaJ superfamily) [Phaffia rhodozyma]